MEALIDVLDESLSTYKQNPTKENLSSLSAVASMFTLRANNASDDPMKRMEFASKTLNDLDELEKLHKTLKGKLS